MALSTQDVFDVIYITMSYCLPTTIMLLNNDFSWFCNSVCDPGRGDRGLPRLLAALLYLLTILFQFTKLDMGKAIDIFMFDIHFPD